MTNFLRIGGFPMDLAVTEEHGFPGEVSKYPVELGPDISDTIRDLPPYVMIEGIVSDSPSGAIADDPTRKDAAGGNAPDPNSPLPSAAALEKLKELKAARLPLVVETSLGTYDSMGFVEFTVTRDKEKTAGLFFHARFERMIIVQNKRTKVRVKTNAAYGSGKVTAVAAKDLPIDQVITWQHGVPPGEPWHPPNPVEKVKVNYNRPNGVPKAQHTVMFQETMRYEALGFESGAVTYIDAKGEVITGDRLEALRRDLQRDRRALDNKKSVDFSKIKDRRDLPAGVRTDRWQRGLGDPLDAPRASTPQSFVPAAP